MYVCFEGMAFPLAKKFDGCIWNTDQTGSGSTPMQELYPLNRVPPISILIGFYDLGILVNNPLTFAAHLQFDMLESLPEPSNDSQITIPLRAHLDLKKNNFALH